MLLLGILYLTFVGLGVPDALLGPAWPSMYEELGVSLSAMGGITMIFAGGKVLANALSDRVIRRLGTGVSLAAGVAVMAVSLLGFAFSHSYWVLCLWAIPYGLGSGNASAAANKYLALHYASRYMSWLHCMWGLGTALGPALMAFALRREGWNLGYLLGAGLAVGMAVLLMAVMPLWKKSGGAETEAARGRAMRLPEILQLPGAKPMMGTFFCYCALEQATALWAATYLTLQRGVDSAAAAGYAGLFFIGMTAGRAVSGFLTLKLTDTRMVLLGQGLVLLGVLLLLQPFFPQAAVAALVVLGLGCAPMYPSMLHSIPEQFGVERSQAVMGILMACANAGTLFMPSLFGWIAGFTGVALYPWFLAGILAVMVLAYRTALRKCAAARQA